MNLDHGMMLGIFLVNVFAFLWLLVVRDLSKECSRGLSKTDARLERYERELESHKRTSHGHENIFHEIFLKRIMEYGMAVFKLGDQVKFQGRAGTWTFSRKDDKQVSPVVITNGEWTEVFEDVLWQDNRIEVSEIAAAGWNVCSLEALR